MKSGSGKDREKKGLLERMALGFTNKLQALFAVANKHQGKGIDFSLLTHRIPLEVVRKLREITSLETINESDEYQVEGGDCSGSGGICRRIIYNAKYIFIIKKIGMTVPATIWFYESC